MKLSQRLLTPTTTRRGMARISAVWMIVMIVLFLVALFFVYVTLSDKQTVQESLASKENEVVEKTEAASVAFRNVNDHAEVIGFYNEEAASKESNLEAAKQFMADVRDQFSIDDTNDTFQELIPEIQAAYRKVVQENGTLQTRIAELEADRDAKAASVTDVSETKDQLIAQLTQEKSDLDSNMSQRIDDLRSENEDLSDQLSDLDSRYREVQSELELTQRRIAANRREYESRVGQLSVALRPLSEPLASKVDATVLAVSDSLPLAWIDIGASDRLAVGTTFDVYAARDLEGPVKARATVVETEADMAQVHISGLRDSLDPVVADDVLKNPLYDPEGEHNAILVGRFDGTWDERELEALLRRIGITVQDEWDVTTHYMIVGSEMWMDSDGQPLEEPIQPSELEDYQNAEQNGTVVIPLANLKQYFKI